MNWEESLILWCRWLQWKTIERFMKKFKSERGEEEYNAKFKNLTFENGNKTMV